MSCQEKATCFFLINLGPFSICQHPRVSCHGFNMTSKRCFVIPVNSRHIVLDTVYAPREVVTYCSHCIDLALFCCQVALLHKSEDRRNDPSPRRSYAMAPTGTVLGRPSCVKRLSRATRTCNSTT